MTCPTASCNRCGARHHTQNPTNYTCITCQRMSRIIPQPCDALPPGQWRNDHGVLRFIPDDPDDWQRNYRATAYNWTDDSIRLAHNAWNRGERNDWAREGERIYQRHKKRAQRQRREAA